MNQVNATAPPSTATYELTGKWTYRSYHNDPTLVGDNAQTALAQIFGEGIFSLMQEDGYISGTLDMGGGYVLDIAGLNEIGSSSAQPDYLRMIGKGRANTPTAGWQYDYQAYLAPMWPTGVAQVPAYIGSVLRAVPHNGKPAGVTASFMMIADLR